MKMRR